MFYYEKQLDDAVMQIKPDMQTAVYFAEEGIRHELMCIRWTILLSSRLGSEEQADWMKHLCVQLLNMAEEMSIVYRRLQGENPMCIDVIDRSNPDMVSVNVSSGQLPLVEPPQLELPPDDYCGALMKLKETCIKRKSPLVYLLGMTRDESYKVLLKKWIQTYDEIVMDCKKRLAEMTHEGQRTFSDDYENERAWELDSGNYFDPKTPIVFDNKH